MNRETWLHLLELRSFSFLMTDQWEGFFCLERGGEDEEERFCVVDEFSCTGNPCLLAKQEDVCCE